MEVGKSINRVDAFDKVTGRTKYTDDLCDAGAYVAKIVHSTIAHGKVLSVDTSEAKRELLRSSLALILDSIEITSLQQDTHGLRT